MASGQKGFVAEEALAAYFRKLGFFAVRGVPFRHDDDEITDVDVWLFEYGSGIDRRRWLVDTKNKRSPKVAERVLWAAGLKQVLAIEGAYVASTGSRPATERLAKRVNVSLFDLAALGDLSDAVDIDRVSREEVTVALSELDQRNEAKNWRRCRDDMLAVLLLSFGGSSANVALRAALFYAEQVLSAPTGTRPHEWGIRMVLFASALVAAGLDFVAAQSSYHSPERRKRDLEDAVRYGSSPDETKARMRFALDLMRADPSTKSLANQVQDRVKLEMEAIPADVIAEVVAKLVPNGQLFETARTLDSVAHSRDLTSANNLDTASKAFLGAVFDFLGLERKDMFDFLSKVKSTEKSASRERDYDNGTSVKRQRERSLFDKK